MKNNKELEEQKEQTEEIEEQTEEIEEQTAEKEEQTAEKEEQPEKIDTYNKKINTVVKKLKEHKKLVIITIIVLFVIEVIYLANMFMNEYMIKPSGTAADGASIAVGGFERKNVNGFQSGVAVESTSGDSIEVSFEAVTAEAITADAVTTESIEVDTDYSETLEEDNTHEIYYDNTNSEENDANSEDDTTSNTDNNTTVIDVTKDYTNNSNSEIDNSQDYLNQTYYDIDSVEYNEALNYKSTEIQDQMSFLSNYYETNYGVKLHSKDMKYKHLKNTAICMNNIIIELNKSTVGELQMAIGVYMEDYSVEPKAYESITYIDGENGVEYTIGAYNNSDKPKNLSHCTVKEIGIELIGACDSSKFMVDYKAFSTNHGVHNLLAYGHLKEIFGDTDNNIIYKEDKSNTKLKYYHYTGLNSNGKGEYHLYYNNLALYKIIMK